MTDIDLAAVIGFDPVMEMGAEPAEMKAKYLAERDKRLRGDGNEQYVEVVAEFSRYVDDPYVEPGFTREPVFDDVEFAIIGGGFGGLLMGARLREAGYTDLRIVEKAGDVGGTWYWNRYPGAMCDVESYVYLPLLEELGYIPQAQVLLRPGDPRAQPQHRPALRPVRQRPVPDRRHRAALGRADGALDHLHRPRRPLHRAVRGDGQRPAEPAEAARHPRGQRVPGAHVPHQPVGLRLHRRRLHREPRQAGRQARRDHRHRGHRHPVHPAPRRGGQGAVRVPAHAVVGRRAQQRRDRSRVGRLADARLAAAADGQLQHPRQRRRRRGGPREGRLDRHLPQRHRHRGQAGVAASSAGGSPATSAPS